MTEYSMSPSILLRLPWVENQSKVFKRYVFVNGMQEESDALSAEQANVQAQFWRSELKQAF